MVHWSGGIRPDPGVLCGDYQYFFQSMPNTRREAMRGALWSLVSARQVSKISDQVLV